MREGRKKEAVKVVCPKCLTLLTLTKVTVDSIVKHIGQHCGISFTLLMREKEDYNG
jgi:hypothetical protein